MRNSEYTRKDEEAMYRVIQGSDVPVVIGATLGFIGGATGGGYLLYKLADSIVPNFDNSNLTEIIKIAPTVAGAAVIGAIGAFAGAGIATLISSRFSKKSDLERKL